MNKGQGKRIVKCVWCGEKYRADEVFVFQEGDRNRYICSDKCINEWEKDQEFKKEEKIKADELYEYVMSIHNMQNLPKGYFPIIQDLRNGTLRYVKGGTRKRYKDGVPYDIIKEAYKLAKKKIEWAKSAKNFENDLQELKYAYAIMESYISRANKKMFKKKQRQNDHNNQETHHPDRIHIGEDYHYKKKHSEDISDLLD